MRGKFTVRLVLATFAVVLFVSLSASAQSGYKKRQSACSKTTDAEIVQAIKQQFEADAEIKEQMRHLNVSVKNRRATLEGWADGKALVAKAAAIAKKTKCVRSVTNRLRKNGGGSCGAGQRPCGDTCIDRRSECTIGN